MSFIQNTVVFWRYSNCRLWESCCFSVLSMNGVGASDIDFFTLIIWVVSEQECDCDLNNRFWRRLTIAYGQDLFLRDIFPFSLCVRVELSHFVSGSFLSFSGPHLNYTIFFFYYPAIFTTSRCPVSAVYVVITSHQKSSQVIASKLLLPQTGTTVRHTHTHTLHWYRLNGTECLNVLRVSTVN